MDNQHLDELMAFCAIPSVSDDAGSCRAAAEFLVAAMEQRGISARLVETPGNPVVVGEKRGASERAILFYSHYDVVPEGDVAGWQSPAFEPRIRDGRLWGRGTADHKGSVLARIQALDLLAGVGEELPVSLRYVVEGSEEVGSPGLLDVLTSLKGDLTAEGGFYSGWSRDIEGRPRVNGGGRGAAGVRVEVSNANRDLHGSFAPLVRSPLTSLTRLLAGMYDEHGRVTVPGFHDGAVAPSDADRAVLERVPFNVEVAREELGIRRFAGESEERLELVTRHFFSPALSFFGLEGSGVPGKGVPASASVTVRASLVPQQEPEQVMAALTAYFEQQSDLPVTVTPLRTGRRPVRAPLESRSVQVAAQAAESVYGQPPVVIPFSSGGGPRDLFMQALGLPLIADAGVSHLGSNDHAADENIYTEHYLNGVRYYAEIMRLWVAD